VRFLAVLLLTVPLYGAEYFPNVTVEDVCTSGYARRTRDVNQRMRRAVYRGHGIWYVEGNFEVDHKIPLCLGGTNDYENLQPLDKKEARAKARIDGHLCREVCRGNLTLEEARERIKDWRNYGSE
jgi:5-methylcytosine-specific restriction endonuclease McrA